MKLSPLPSSLRQAARLGLTGAAFLCAGSVSAGSYTYQVVNNTFSGGAPAFPVADDVTFTNLQLTETFFDGFQTSVSLENAFNKTQTSLDTGTIALESDRVTLSDPLHGALSAAVLTGSLEISGLGSNGPLSLTLQPTLDPASQYQQLVSRTFSTSLLGLQPNGGIGVGVFSLLGRTGDAEFSTRINATPVPEAATTVSLGLMLLLGLGGMVIARRRRAAANAE